MLGLIKKIVGTKNDREIKRIRPFVDQINSLEADYQCLSDDELKAKTEQFKKRVEEATAALKKDLEDARNETVDGDSDRREELRTQVEELDKELRQKEDEVLEELLTAAFAAIDRTAPFRRSIDRWHGLARGQDLRNENRRR